jgi:hypothetical protein
MGLVLRTKHGQGFMFVCPHVAAAIRERSLCPGMEWRIYRPMCPGCFGEWRQQVGSSG